MDTVIKKNAGYKYLLAYKITVPIYDYTVVFCNRYIDPHSRTRDQMIQSARSGMQNIAEGNKQQSLQGYIKLSGVSRGSLEELLNDYLSYGRQKKIPTWPSEKAKREISEIGEIWKILRETPTLPNSPDFPALPNNLEKAVNLMITLINQANFLIDKLLISLNEKHMKEGGFSEQLYRKRIEYRNRNRN